MAHVPSQTEQEDRARERTRGNRKTQREKVDTKKLQSDRWEEQQSGQKEKTSQKKNNLHTVRDRNEHH